jgi:hypothetical protein
MSVHEGVMKSIYRARRSCKVEEAKVGGLSDDCGVFDPV